MQFITTFHKEGLYEYGRDLIATFSRWAKEHELHILYEGSLDELPSQDNIFYYPISDCQFLIDFKKQHAGNARANGFCSRSGLVTAEKDFRFDVVRFSHKVFTLNFFLDKFLQQDTVFFCWLDADCVLHRQLDQNFFDWCLPAPDQLCSYLNRKTYPECGFMCFNLYHPATSGFIKRFVSIYTSGQLYSLKEWHDSYVFWQLVLEFENYGFGFKRLASDFMNGHVALYSYFGGYFDHRKGERKKAAVSSEMSHRWLYRARYLLTLLLLGRKNYCQHRETLLFHVKE